MRANDYARLLAIPLALLGAGEAVVSHDALLVALVAWIALREIIGMFSLWIRARYRWREDPAQKTHVGEVNAARAALGLGPLDPPPEQQ